MIAKSSSNERTLYARPSACVGPLVVGRVRSGGLQTRCPLVRARVCYHSLLFYNSIKEKRTARTEQNEPGVKSLVEHTETDRESFLSIRVPQSTRPPNFLPRVDARSTALDATCKINDTYLHQTAIILQTSERERESETKSDVCVKERETKSLKNTPPPLHTPRQTATHCCTRVCER